MNGKNITVEYFHVLRIFSDSSKYDIKRLSATKNRCAFGFIQQPAKSVNISSTIGRFYCKVSLAHKRAWFENGLVYCVRLTKIGCRLSRERKI